MSAPLFHSRGGGIMETLLYMAMLTSEMNRKYKKFFKGVEDI